jgi:hypothetical protein
MRKLNFLVMPMIFFISASVALSKSNGAPFNVVSAQSSFVTSQADLIAGTTVSAVAIGYLQTPGATDKCKQSRRQALEKAYGWADANCSSAKSLIDNQVRPAVEFEVSRCSASEQCSDGKKPFANDAFHTSVWGISISFGMGREFLQCGDAIPAFPVVKAKCFQGRANNIKAQQHPPGEKALVGP